MRLVSWVAIQTIWQNLKILVILVVTIIVSGSFWWIPNPLANSSAIALSISSIPTAIEVSLGNNRGELKFFPSNLQLEAGKPYKLLLDNPSPVKHYFTAKDFADASWTKKVEAGQVEVKGAIHELELKPGAEAEWILTPMKPGTYELHCSIKGHAASGMVGQILIR